MTDERIMELRLPWVSADMSGHNTGNRYAKGATIRALRTTAHLMTKNAKIIAPDGKGDIRLHVRFHAPDNKGDRTNYWNRIKPYIDGIADGMKTEGGGKVNDRRFLPSMEIGENIKGGAIVFEIGGPIAPCRPLL